MQVVRKDRWTQFDEFGLLVGLGQFSQDGKELLRVRKAGETNRELKTRIDAVFSHLSNSSKQGLVNGICRDLGLTRYNVIDKNIFYLSTDIDPQRHSAMKVYTSSDEGSTWTELTPRLESDHYVETEGGAYARYSTASAGWILWRRDTNSFTRIVEIVSTLADQTRIKLEYPYLNDQDDEVTMVDVDKEDDNITEMKPYTYRVADTPGTRTAVIYTLDEFADLSSVDDYLVKAIAEYMMKNYPIEWGKFVFDRTRWDADTQGGRYAIDTLFDAERLADASGYMGGIDYGTDLHMVGKEITPTGWFARLSPGKFYIGPTPYYLYESKKERVLGAAGSGYVAPWTTSAYGFPVSTYTSDSPNDEGPIVITDGRIATDPNIAAMYQYPCGVSAVSPTADKYMPVHNMEYVQEGGGKPTGVKGYWMDYDHGRIHFVRNYYPTGRITLEYEGIEASGNYKALMDVNLDPNLNGNAADRFLVMDNFANSPEYVRLDHIGPGITWKYAEFKINVYGRYGEPLNGENVRIVYSDDSLFAGTAYTISGLTRSSITDPNGYTKTHDDGAVYYGLNVQNFSVGEYRFKAVTDTGVESDIVRITIGRRPW